MGALIKVVKSLFGIYAIVLFLITMIIVFPFILFFSLLTRKKKDKYVYQTLRLWSLIWYALIFIRHKAIGRNDFDEHKQYIYVANHSSYLDIPQLLLAVQRPVKILARHDLGKIPVFGTIYKSATISVNRDVAKDRANSYQQLKKNLQNGFSVFLFPEGTFNETGQPLKAFHDGAFKLSAEMNIPIKPIVFPDTIKRLNSKIVFGFTPGICRSIFLKEIYPEVLKSTAIADLKDLSFKKMSDALLNAQK